MEPLPGKFGAGAALPPPGEPQILPRWAETPGPWAKSCPLRRVRARVAALLVSFYLTFSEVPSPPLRMSSFWELKNLFFERTPCCRSLQRHRMHVVFHPQSSPVLVPAYMNPVAPRPRGIHQLTDNVAESHKQGTTTLLCSGWLDPFPSDFGLISLV